MKIFVDLEKMADRSMTETEVALVEFTDGAPGLRRAPSTWQAFSNALLNLNKRGRVNGRRGR